MVSSASSFAPGASYSVPKYQTFPGQSIRFVQNEVLLSGQLQSPLTPETVPWDSKSLGSFLGVNRLSGTVDLLPISFPAHLFRENAPTLDQGSFVSISGQFLTFTDDQGHFQLRVRPNILSTECVPAVDDNFVRLTGEIATKPNYRVTPFGRQVTDFLLSVHSGLSSFGSISRVPLLFWGKLASVLSSYKVGEVIQVCGRFQSREYQKSLPDGTWQPRTALEVSCHHFTPLERNLVTNRGIF